MDVDAQKRAAAARALEFVRPGMRLGLGTGSTAKHFVELLAERVRAGLDVIAVPTSEATRSDAERLGVPLTNLDETPALDLTVDGADEIAHDLSLIKGGGGALLREKIVASASARMIVIADESKWVSALGRFPLPVEVVPFGLGATRRAVEAAAAAVGCAGPALLRRAKDGHAFVTDSGHWILDAAFERIADPKSLAERLDGITGVVEHGLFIGLAHAAVVAGSSGVEPVSSEEEVLMFAFPTLRAPCAVTLALGLAFALGIATADAQQPSPSAVATAKEVITAKGATALYSPLVSGVIERTKSVFLQTNPMLGKDLNEVAAKLHSEYGARSAELVNEVAKLYASRFTEQELKDTLAFYKSPLGRKLIVEEPAVLDQSMKTAQTWAENLSQEVIAKMRAEMKKRGHDI